MSLSNFVIFLVACPLYVNVAILVSGAVGLC
jgi:hypothetical protein